MRDLLTKMCFYVIIWIVFLQIIKQRWEEKKLKNKIFDISLSVCGGFLALMGFIIIFTNFLVGLFMMLSGVALIPSIYERSKEFLKEYSAKIPKKYYDKMGIFWNKGNRYVKITLPVMFLVLSLVLIPRNNAVPASVEASEPVSFTVQDAQEPAEEEKEDEKPEVTDLHFDDTELQLDINESKNLVLKISPENAETENIEYCTSNEKVASLEEAYGTPEENSINLKLNPASEGECEVFAKTSNDIESNKVLVKVVDKERILAEEKAKKEDEMETETEAEEEEEQVRQEAEKKVEETAEKQAKKAATEKKQIKTQAEEKKSKAVDETKKALATSSASKSTNNTKSSPSTKSNKKDNSSNGTQIYRTPKGKRYHFDPNCGGKNSYSTTLDDALSAGLTPCKKCVRQ